MQVGLRDGTEGGVGSLHTIRPSPETVVARVVQVGQIHELHMSTDIDINQSWEGYSVN